MAVSRMDFLLGRDAAFDQRVKPRLAPSPESGTAVTETDDRQGEGKAGDGKKDGKGSGGFFGTAVGEIFFRGTDQTRSSILSITHPSDGHPQEELTPDFNWFRPLTFNNQTWTLYWPELTI